jgi:hypothetical protein
MGIPYVSTLRCFFRQLICGVRQFCTGPRPTLFTNPNMTTIRLPHREYCDQLHVERNAAPQSTRSLTHPKHPFKTSLAPVHTYASNGSIKISAPHSLLSTPPTAQTLGNSSNSQPSPLRTHTPALTSCTTTHTWLGLQRWKRVMLMMATSARFTCATFQTPKD